MNRKSYEPRSITETLSLLCHAKGGKLIRAGAINQSEIARQTGITQATISRWYEGTSKPTDDNIKKLSKYFKVTPAQMRGEVPIESLDGLTARSPEDEQLLAEFAGLPEEAKQMIRDQISLLRKLSRE